MVVRLKYDDIDRFVLTGLISGLFGELEFVAELHQG
jgi:hypothetical protein